MALRLLRASSASLVRHSRSISTSLPLHRRTHFHPEDLTPSADNTNHDTNAEADLDPDLDASNPPNHNHNHNPPTSPVFPISNNTTTTTHPKTRNNPFRLPILSQDATTAGRIVHLYHMHVLCTPNNTHVLIRDAHGRPLKGASWSGGACGFKGVNRSGYEAGYQCAVRAFARVKQLVQEEGGGAGVGVGGMGGMGVSRARLEVIFKGFGQGRDAVSKALMTSEGDDVRPYIVRVTDNTPIKIGGTRARKTRRL